MRKLNQSVSTRVDNIREVVEKSESKKMKGSVFLALVSFKLTFIKNFFVKGEIKRGTAGFVDSVFSAFEVFFKKLY